MDKKKGIILGVVTAIIIVLLIAVFVMDANTEKISPNAIVEIEGTEYTVDDFKKFIKLVNLEDGDINKVMTEEETLTILDEYLVRKLFSTAANTHQIKVEAETLQSFETDYEKNSTNLTNAGISKEEYINFKTEQELVEILFYDFAKYYTLPDATYNEFKEQYKNLGEYKTYNYRMMFIPYEEKVSGDTSGDEVDLLESGDKEDLSKEAQTLVANDVLARIKSGESFEDLAKTYGTPRYGITQTGTLYMTKNGAIESVTSPMLDGALFNSTVLINAVKGMQSGDLSEVIDDTQNTSFTIIKLEGIEEGFVGDAEKELKDALLMQEASNIVSENAHWKTNESALMRALYIK